MIVIDSVVGLELLVCSPTGLQNGLRLVSTMYCLVTLYHVYNVFVAAVQMR